MREIAQVVANDIDSEILTQLRNGDHKAFDYVYLHYSDSLLGFLTKLLRSREDAEEITQNVFIKIWEKRELIDPEKGIKRYLYWLAKAHAFDYFDHLKVREKYVSYVANTENDILANSAEDLILNKETAILMDIAIERMPPKQKEVFLLSRESGISYEEIAQRLQISKNTVRNHISTAIKELKEVVLLFLLFLNS